MFNLSAHPATQGLGSIGTNPKNPERGALMHCSLAMTAQGLPLGLIDSLTFTRKLKAKTAKAKRAIDQKESFKWLQSLAACQGADDPAGGDVDRPTGRAHGPRQ